MSAMLASLRRRHEATAELWRTNPGSIRAYVLVTGWTLYAGLALVLGSPSRTSGPSYRVINDAGGPVLVGAILLGLAVLLVVAPWIRPDVLRLALLADCGVHVTMGSGFALSARADSNAGLLAPGLFALVLLWCISQAELYRTTRASPR